MTDVEIEQLLFRDAMTAACLARGVRPQAVRFVLREAADHFVVKDGSLVAKTDVVDPNDPIVPLSVDRWLERLASTDGVLFTPDHGATN